MMVTALLATEDSRFFEHYGLDYIGVLRAIYGDLEGRREGASTITMQVARNFYLSHNAPWRARSPKWFWPSKLSDVLEKKKYWNVI